MNVSRIFKPVITCAWKIHFELSFIGTGAAEIPHMFGDLLLTPEQEKRLISKGGELEGMEQGYLYEARLWPWGIVPFTYNHNALSKFG